MSLKSDRLSTRTAAQPMAAFCGSSLRADPRSWDSGAMKCGLVKRKSMILIMARPVEGSHGSRVALEVARQATVSADRGESALGDPMQLIALDGGHGSSVALEVARQATVSADPSEGALAGPTFG